MRALPASLGFFGPRPILKEGTQENRADVAIAEQRIGRYVLLEPIGRGAMGVVYRAEDPLIHRTVAVKVLDLARGATPEQIALARARFLREAEAAGGIDHPNIIRVFDAGSGEGAGEMYIVMEYVAGPSLEGLLHGGALGFERSVALIGQLASGLDAAHAQGIVHRDVKPSNILLTEDEAVAKIADFGITYIANSALTLDMKALGTPAYMSPEQVGGKNLDSRSDLFSLGVLAYEMLTGRKPFEGADAVSVAHAIAYATPLAISVANPELPRSLDGVMERGLSKNPSDRFETAKEFHEALTACLSDEAAGLSSVSRSGSGTPRWWLWGIAGLALLAAVVLWTRDRPAVPTAVSVPVASRPASTVAPSPRSVPATATAMPSRPSVKVAKPAPRASAPQPKPIAGYPRTAPSQPARVATQAPTPAPAPVSAPAPDVTVTISVASRLRRGTLVVTLDDKPIFGETFSKSRLALVQTTVWDPLHAPAGAHVIGARVTGEDGKTYAADPTTVTLPGGKAIALRFRLKGDVLTLASDASEGGQAP